MTRPRVSFTFNKQGQATVEVGGIAGPSCKDITAKVEEALGAKIEETETHEYHEQPEALPCADIS